MTLPRRVKAEVLEAAAPSERVASDRAASQRAASDRAASDRAASQRSALQRAALQRAAGEWVVAAAADHGRWLQDALGEREVRRRPRMEDAAFSALSLTPDERDELDEMAVACGLNRSAFVSSVSRLALGEEMDAVVAPLVEPG